MLQGEVYPQPERMNETAEGSLRGCSYFISQVKPFCDTQEPLGSSEIAESISLRQGRWMGFFAGQCIGSEEGLGP